MRTQHRLLRAGGIAVGLLLMLACGGREARQSAVPTTLSGEVFTITRDGATVKARGSTLNMVVPTSRILDAADSTCAYWESFEYEVLSKTPLAKHLETRAMIGDAASGAVMGSAYREEPIAIGTTDLQGEFQLVDPPSGGYLFWTKTDVGVGRIFWLTYAIVRSGAANRVILGTDATNWREMCNAAVRARRNAADLVPR